MSKFWGFRKRCQTQLWSFKMSSKSLLGTSGEILGWPWGIPKNRVTDEVRSQMALAPCQIEFSWLPRHFSRIQERMN